MNLIEKIGKLKRVFGLSISLAKAEFKLRNEGSYLGIFWYLLNPLLLFILLFFIFSNTLGSNIKYYPIYLMLGIVMFNFFQSITTSSITNTRDHNLIIKSIKFPKEALVLSTLFRCLFSHIFEIALLIVFMIFFKVPLMGFIYYPLVLFIFCVFIYGCSLILSSLYIYFTDLNFIWEFATRILFFVTPIFYQGNSSSFFIVNIFNPVYYFISFAREICLYNNFNVLLFLENIGFALLFLLIGTLIFNKLKLKFSELL